MIILKDKHGNTQIKISNFYKRYNSKPIFLETDVEIILKASNHIEKIELEFQDLKKLKFFTEELNRGSAKYFVLENIDQQFQISFEVVNAQNIKLKGFLKNKTYTRNWDFCFETTLDEMSSLISSITTIEKNIHDSDSV